MLALNKDCYGKKVEEEEEWKEWDEDDIEEEW